ncbi:PREDICTED: nijmegen breakage syndrome 1 protein [Tarenaya hassleriana]|uniref:nijmegen breakage syndrome 1 protein n=1 Tax=Tarenaya hassleriana TaxID=28532 RepID=UPI00053C08D5|nr:PREDICTED: nijmegen breakage syndrome 1 protein [Tarenaya hassleriana]
MVWGLLPVDPLSGEEKYYIFFKGTYKIGRRGCDIIINKDKGVSRVHAEITFDTMVAPTSQQNRSSRTSSNIRIKDCSKYGTFIKSNLGTKDKVHELPNKEAVLRDGDIVTFGTGAATYRFSYIQLVFFFCPCSMPFKVDCLVRDDVSSIGASMTPTLTEECTHVLVEPHVQVNEDLINAILSKKTIILTSWVKLIAEKNVRSEIPGYNQFIPAVMVEDTRVNIVDPKVREKCLEGYAFVLEPTYEYKFGGSFQSLLKVCGAETVSIEEISSMSQDSEYGEINRMVCVIPKSSGDKFGRFKHLSLLSKVNEMDLICAVLSGNLASSSLIPPSVVISSSCSTDETVVADSDAEENTESSVRVIDTTEKLQSPKHSVEEEIKDEADATKMEDSPVMILDQSNEFKSVDLAEAENRGNAGDIPSEVTIRRDRNEGPECGNPDIIYSQDLIVRDTQSIRTVLSAGDGGVVNFKRFRKGNITSGNSFSNLIPFSKDPYKEYDSGEMTDYIKEEKKRKQMEAIAEDLFNNEKARKRGTAGSIREFLTRA